MLEDVTVAVIVRVRALDGVTHGRTDLPPQFGKAVGEARGLAGRAERRGLSAGHWRGEQQQHREREHGRSQ